MIWQTTFSNYILFFSFNVILSISNVNGQIDIVQKPISFDNERRILSLEYLDQHYGIIQNEPTIVPKIIVVHWTVIPTMEKTFDAFYNTELPKAREGISAASQLNVSSQYLIDRDGTIYQLLPDTVFARHTIGLNHCAIGIENVGGDDQPLTKQQLKSNIDLIKLLSSKYPIEYLIGHFEYQKFIGHPLWKEIDSNYLTVKTDPNKGFMRKIRRKLKKYNLQGPPKSIH